MKSIVVANWKMNPQTFRDAKKLLEGTKKAVESAKTISVIVAPPALYLRELKVLGGRKLSFAAQNAHAEAGGAHTGEIAMAQVKDAKVSHVLIGHAERRAMGESTEDAKRKLASALKEGLTPIFCVGETSRSAAGEHYTFVREQLSALRDVPQQKLASILIAYEPVWAIGAEKPMSPRDMHQMGIFIRKVLVEMHGEKAMKVKILYGGSVDATNAVQMVTEADVDGLLVGRVSTNVDTFAALLTALQEA